MLHARALFCLVPLRPEESAGIGHARFTIHSPGASTREDHDMAGLAEIQNIGLDWMKGKISKFSALRQLRRLQVSVHEIRNVLWAHADPKTGERCIGYRDCVPDTLCPDCRRRSNGVCPSCQDDRQREIRECYGPIQAKNKFISTRGKNANT